MCDIAALIITFNPDTKRLEHNLKLTKKQIKVIVVVDNGSDNLDEIFFICKKCSVRLIKNRKNFGIAFAQNRGFKVLYEDNFQWALTLDQDSLIPSNTLNELRNSGKMKSADTGIIALSYFDRNWSDKQKKLFKNEKGQNLMKVKFVISSGNLVNIRAWKAVNGFDEKLFIDMVDYDFDARLELKGYEIWQLNNVYLNHEIGKVVHKPFLERLLLLPDRGRLADHSAFRQYYIYRNYIIFYKRYPMFVKKRFLVLRTFLSTRRIFVYDDSWRKFKRAWTGILDGMKYKPQKDVYFQENIKKLTNRGDI